MDRNLRTRWCDVLPGGQIGIRANKRNTSIHEVSVTGRDEGVSIQENYRQVDSANPVASFGEGCLTLDTSFTEAAMDDSIPGPKKASAS